MLKCSVVGARRYLICSAVSLQNVLLGSVHYLGLCSRQLLICAQYCHLSAAGWYDDFTASDASRQNLLRTHNAYLGALCLQVT
jgi:hypothetical protein